MRGLRPPGGRLESLARNLAPGELAPRRGEVVGWGCAGVCVGGAVGAEPEDPAKGCRARSVERAQGGLEGQ